MSRKRRVLSRGWNGGKRFGRMQISCIWQEKLILILAVFLLKMKRKGKKMESGRTGKGLYINSENMGVSGKIKSILLIIILLFLIKLLLKTTIFPVQSGKSGKS